STAPPATRTSTLSLHDALPIFENPGAPPYEYRAERALKKARAGARFLQLQICFEPDRLEAFAVEAARIGVTPGVALLPSITILRDRKSTRLNSSHLVISYAVFC